MTQPLRNDKREQLPAASMTQNDLFEKAMARISGHE